MEASQKKPYPLIGILFSLFWLSLTSYCSMVKPDSMIVVPVADVSGNYPSFFKNLDPEHESTRIHQELLHTLVKKVKTSGPYTLIEIPSIWIGENHSHTFWTLSSNIKSLDLITNNGAYQQCIPSLVDSQALKTIVLIYPYHDKKNKRTLSAGTRFVLHKQEKNKYLVSIFNNDTEEWETLSIPTKLCKKTGSLKPPHEQRKEFISVLHAWSHQKKGFIPYVLGGCSFCTVDPRPYKNRTEKLKKHQTGIDCSGLVWLVANKICNIPYYFKNTTALEKEGIPLQPHELIQEGDLIWIPGHVLVIASIPNNTVIEARGYPHEYGRVHEIAISKVFKDTKTIADLRSAIENNFPLTRLDKKGHVRDTFFKAKIIKLC